MPQPIFTSLSPNTDSSDIKVALKTLLTPWKNHSQKRVDVIQKLESIFSKKAFLTTSGRGAITDTLNGLGISKDDEVIIQAFTCLAVPNAIKWADATPVYADINPETYNLTLQDVQQRITSKTKAIIIQHTFGIPCPETDEIIAFTKSKNIFVIEDLAHSLQHPVFNTGCLTPGVAQSDAAILSFGRDKIISSVFGGAVITNNEKLITHMQRIQDERKPAGSIWTKKQLLHPIFMAIIKPLYFTFSIGKVILVAFQKLSFMSMAVSSHEKQGTKPTFINRNFPNWLIPLLTHQLTKLDNLNRTRRQNVAKYADTLNLPPSHPHRRALLRFPLEVQDPLKILNQAKQKNILLGDWYQSPVIPNVNITGYKAGSCPNAEASSKKIVNLPTLQYVDPRNIK